MAETGATGRVVLVGRSALVTGAGRRIGRAIAEALGAQKMTVVVHYSSSDDGARETAAAIEKAGGVAHVVQANLLEPDAAENLVRESADLCGGLDLVVNSAATMTCTPIGTVTTSQWDEIIALNLRAPFFIAQAAAALMREGGSIINMADLAAFETWPDYVPHGISKAGVVQMTRALARALGPAVRVNAIAPGAVLLPDGWDEETATRLASTTPLRRIGEPQDVVDALLYLATSPYVTGQTLIVDGGREVRH